MLELRFVQGNLLKMVLDAIKDLVYDAKFDCSASGLDSAGFALVAQLLRSEGFEHYRCDRSISMGMDFKQIENMVISVTKEGVNFSAIDDKTNIVKAVKPKDATVIEMKEPLCLSLSLVYLNSFTKANPLSNYVTISFPPEFPALVEYTIAEIGYLRLYLSPMDEKAETMQALEELRI